MASESGKIKRVFQGIRELWGGGVNGNGQEVAFQEDAQLSVPKVIAVIGKEGIEKILPHRGRMLLLDEVEINTELVLGKLLVREEFCEGHAVADGKPVLRGSDLLDMAAQLLGMWASQHADFQGKRAMVRRYGEAKFQSLISAGDNLALEVRPNNLQGEITLRGDFKKIIITGKEFSAKVGSVQKAFISFVELYAF